MLALLIAFSASASVNLEQLSAYRSEILKRGAVATSRNKMGREEGLAELFVGANLETNCNTLISRGLSRGSVRKQPWSGHTWSHENGGLAFRWADPSMPSDYGNGRNYVQRVRWNQTYWNYLSPAEKYDYLTGLTPGENGSLTKQQWGLGAEEYRTTGQVTGWHGICHGWSPASIYMPQPKRDVLFNFPEGQLSFTIDDIKAIGALYWANGKYESVFAGWRCNEANPAHNADGRILDSKCFDVNPGDWHLALTNMVGARREPFIIDAAETLQIWNFPVTSYSMQFFDPTNFDRRSTSPQGLFRSRSGTPNLRHGQFRSPKTVWVIGVVSTILVADNSNPGERRNLQKEFTFTYDLELDENYQVIGGEWRNAARPDFLWRRKDQQVPMPHTGGDVQLDMWRMGDANWRRASLENTTKGMPIKFFVEQLFQLAQ
mgnify:CR=1 FL=1